MTCETCGNAVTEEGVCAACASRSAEASPGGGAGSVLTELAAAAAILGVLWLGGKAVKAVAGSASANGSGAPPLELPEEFQANRTRAATEIPGQPMASQLEALRKVHEQREYHAELGRMMRHYLRWR